MPQPHPICVPCGLLLLAAPAVSKILLGTPPRGWEDFDSHTQASYNETYARAAAAVMAEEVLPLGYDQYIIGGWSMGGQVDDQGIPVHNTSKFYTVLDEYGRPVPDNVRFPSSAVTPDTCHCFPRNCTDPRQQTCTDPVCVCPEGARSLRPFASQVEKMGLKLGLWTWRGVHMGAYYHKLKVKGTNYTIDEIVDQKPRNCGFGPWYPVNASHPGAKYYYDSLYDLFVDQWGIGFVKADCEDTRRLDEILLQSQAADKARGGVYLSYSPGTFGPDAATGQWVSLHQAATMYRITSDFHGGWGELASDRGSFTRAALHANASNIGLNGSFPDLDMMPLGQIFCDRYGPATVDDPKCDCMNCNGGGMAYTIASLWAISRSPLLLGGALPLDAPTMSIIGNPGFDLIHTHSRNQTVIAFHQPNISCKRCNQTGWQVWKADLMPNQLNADKALMVFNVGDSVDKYFVTWSQLGLQPSPEQRNHHANHISSSSSSKGYNAVDVWSGEVAIADDEGFTVEVNSHNATLILIVPKPS